MLVGRDVGTRGDREAATTFSTTEEAPAAAAGLGGGAEVDLKLGGVPVLSEGDTEAVGPSRVDLVWGAVFGRDRVLLLDFSRRCVHDEQLARLDLGGEGTRPCHPGFLTIGGELQRPVEPDETSEGGTHSRELANDGAVATGRVKSHQVHSSLGLPRLRGNAQESSIGATVEVVEDEKLGASAHVVELFGLEINFENAGCCWVLRVHSCGNT